VLSWSVSSQSASAGPFRTDHPAKIAFLFGNNCQAIEIAKGHFGVFSKCALKSLHNQTDFDSADTVGGPAQMATTSETATIRNVGIGGCASPI
jgi:hypothetical protein